jgi:hypothetical protein
MARTPSTDRRATLLRIVAACTLPALLATSSGCINVFAMGAKILMGDPQVVSDFQRQTGVELQAGEQWVAVVVDAPGSALRVNDSLTVDLQDQLIRRMKLRGVTTANADDVTRVLEDAGGQFSANEIVREMDVDVVLHVQIEGYTEFEDGNPRLYRGRAKGLVVGYRAVGEPGKPGRHAVSGYQQEFLVEFPGMHPIPADQTPLRVFQQDFVDQIAAQVGRQFYDVPRSDIF